MYDFNNFFFVLGKKIQTNKQTNNNFHSFDDKCNYYF